MAINVTYINYILDTMQVGILSYTEVRNLFLRNVKKVSEPTFVKYWKIAKAKYEEIQNDIQKEKEQYYKDSEIEKKRLGILQRDEIVKMTSNALVLAYNKVIESKGGEKEMYSYATILEKFAKLEGFDKPIKVADTDSEGNDKMDRVSEVVFKVEPIITDEE